MSKQTTQEKAAVTAKDTEAILTDLVADPTNNELLKTVFQLKDADSLSSVHELVMDLLFEEDRLDINTHKEEVLSLGSKLFKALQKSPSELQIFRHIVAIHHPKTAERKVAIKALSKGQTIDINEFRNCLLEMSKELDRLTSNNENSNASETETLPSTINSITTLISSLRTWPNETGGLAGDAADAVLKISSIERERNIDLKLRKECDKFFAKYSKQTLELTSRSDETIESLGNTLPLTPGKFREYYLFQLALNKDLQLNGDEALKSIKFESIALCITKNPDGWTTALENEYFKAQIQQIINDRIYKGTLKLETFATLISSNELFSLVDVERFEKRLTGLKKRNPAINTIGILLSQQNINQLTAEYEKTINTNEESVRERSSEAEANIQRITSELEQEREKNAQTLSNITAENEQLKERLGEKNREFKKASNAELNQRWIDAAKITIEILKELERMPVTSESEIRPVEIAKQIARTYNIYPLSEKGSTVVFEPDKYRIIQGEPTKDVTVIELAYATDKFGDETILERGMAEPTKNDDLNE